MVRASCPLIIKLIINTGAIATATAVLTTACARKTTSTATQSSLPTVRWRMATSWTKTLGTYIGADTMAKRVKEMSWEQGKNTVLFYMDFGHNINKVILLTVLQKNYHH